MHTCKIIAGGRRAALGRAAAGRLRLAGRRERRTLYYRL